MSTTPCKDGVMIHVTIGFCKHGNNYLKRLLDFDKDNDKKFLYVNIKKNAHAILRPGKYFV